MAEVVALHLILESIYGHLLFVDGTSGIVDENVEMSFALENVKGESAH